MDRWRVALENLALWSPQMRIEARDTCSLGQVIELLVSSATSIPYIFISATRELLSTVSNYDHPSFRGAPWLDFCARNVMEQSRLWSYINILQFATPRKDDTLRAFVLAMRDHLKQEWLYIFGDSADQRISEMLRFLEFHTPVNEILPGIEIPGMTQRYWTNVLSLRKWHAQLEFNADVYVDPKLRGDRVEFGAPSQSRFDISAIYYSQITALEGTEDFINYAYPGIILTKKIWEKILSSRALSNASRQFFNRHVPCLRETFGLTDKRRISIFLGLRSALKLGRVPDWHLASISSRRYGSISRSKLFYLLYYRNNVCKELVDGYITLDEAAAIARLLRHTSDFNQAFNCKLVKHGETCLFE
ncbi:unnamed protein product [Ixodes pacificus]